MFYTTEVHTGPNIYISYFSILWISVKNEEDSMRKEFILDCVSSSRGERDIYDRFACQDITGTEADIEIWEITPVQSYIEYNTKKCKFGKAE